MANSKQNGAYKSVKRDEWVEDVELKDFSSSQNDQMELDDSHETELLEVESDDEKVVVLPRDRRRSSSTIQSFMLYTPDEENAVVRKFDRRLVLLLALLYMLSFLDRSSMIRACSGHFQC